MSDVDKKRSFYATMKKAQAKIHPKKRKAEKGNVFSYKLSKDSRPVIELSSQQFSDIEEDSQDYSMFSEEGGQIANAKNPVKLNKGLKEIEARILRKAKERK